MDESIKQTINQTSDATKKTVNANADAMKSATDTMRQGADQAHDAFQDNVVEPAKRAGEVMKVSGQRMVENGSALSAKMIDLAEANTRHAFAVMRAAAQAKDPSEIMKIQGDYLREQSQRSMGQAREIGEMIAQFGRDSLSMMRKG